MHRMKNSHILVFFFIFLLLPFSKCNAQITFTGSITDENNLPINRARIFVKTEHNSKYTFTNEKGNFQIKLESIPNDSLAKVVANAINYNNDTITVPLSKNTISYTANFKLKLNSKTIEEVIVLGKRKPIEIKKDTVVYNPENFSDGSERNVEDLLKKLPGITVNESGSIEFKGKTVSAVMLDGGNLFNANYMTGTRSINPNIIDQVQAIENWSENPILKGYNTDNAVALNLKLKKNKSSFSSSLNTETDLHKRHNIGGYILTINNVIKTFATSNFNNVGKNKSPINPSNNSYSFQDYQNIKYQTPFVINTDPIDIQLGSEKANRNQQWFNSSNSIFKLGNKVNLKIIASALKDKILIDNISENYYTLNNETIYTKDENKIEKKPNYFTGEIELKWNKSNKEFIELYNYLSFLDENISNNLISNSNNNYNLTKNIKNIFSKNELIYTLKLKEKNVLQIKTLYTYNKKPQNLLITPSLTLFPNNDLLSTNSQGIMSTKEHFGLDFILHHLFSENHKLNISTGFANQSILLNSHLNANNSISVESFDNDMNYNTNSYYINFDYAFKNKQCDIALIQRNQLYQQRLNENMIISKDIFLNNSNLSISRTLFNKTSVFFIGNISSVPINERYLFSRYILVSNRNIVHNNISLDYENQESYTTGISYNDSFTSQFKAILSVGFTKNKNGFTSRYFISQNLDYTLNYRLNNPFQSQNIVLNIEKYFAFISSRFNLKTAYYKSNYYNTINNSDLTKIISQSLEINLIHQFAFNFPLKIKNNFDYIQTVNKSEISSKNKNNSFSVKNNFSYSFNRNSLIFNFGTEYYKPDFKQKNNLVFLNFNLDYLPKDSRFKYSLSLNNISNERYNYSKYVRDYSINFHKIELLQRTFLAGINLNF